MGNDAARVINKVLVLVRAFRDFFVPKPFFQFTALGFI